MQPKPSPPRSLLAQIFITPQERRLRTSWRLAAHTFLFLALLFPLTLPFFLFYFVPEAWLRPFLGNLVDNRLLVVAAPPQLLATFLSVYLARRFIDRRSFSSLGIGWRGFAGRDLLVGILMTIPIMGLIFTLEWALGWLQFSGFAWQTQSLPTILLQILTLLVVFILVGFGEELLFRGYWLKNLTEGLNFIWAVVVSSLAFGLAHAGNDGFNLPALIGLALAGVFFAYSVRQTGSLWLAIGLHIGWNFFEGPIFGFQVSGLKAFRLIEYQVQGPAIWTGGDFGPEAGLVLIPALLLGTLLIALYTHNREVVRDEASGGP
jgi:membrane protease YdiL (CAAX protease family)